MNSWVRSIRKRDMESQPQVNHNTKIAFSIEKDYQSHVISENSESLEETDDEIDMVDTSQIIEQGLIQELAQNQYEVDGQSNSTSSDDEINKPCIQNIENLIPGSAESLSYLFDKAIKKGQEEILCWYYYSLEFENRVKSLIANDRQRLESDLVGFTQSVQ
ncbi:10188_t:CDS:2 [Entrophospora sp. SA101]|nr:10188_t:CDS:2 [Entrophospora sp. SA101]